MDWSHYSWSAFIRKKQRTARYVNSRSLRDGVLFYPGAIELDRSLFAIDNSSLLHPCDDLFRMERNQRYIEFGLNEHVA